MLNTLKIILFLISLNVYSQTHEFHHPNKLLNQLTTEKEPARKIYNAYCANCHDKTPLIEINAPKFRQSDDWNVRLKQSKVILFKNVNEGLNAMPPRGGCFECSDELLLLTIEYMLPKIKK